MRPSTWGSEGAGADREEGIWNSGWKADTEATKTWIEAPFSEMPQLCYSKDRDINPRSSPAMTIYHLPRSHQVTEGSEAKTEVTSANFPLHPSSHNHCFPSLLPTPFPSPLPNEYCLLSIPLLLLPISESTQTSLLEILSSQWIFCSIQ